MLPARLIVDPPLPGDWNMAVDEALLESAAEGIACLRFYQWSEPTLSLGYFQQLADRALHVASRDCPLVRRASGGGAIVHDRELTYSFVTPIEERFATSSTTLYDAFHKTLLEALATFAVVGRLFEADAGDAEKPRSSAFLCFERRTPGDVLCENQKICGSAQRRRRGALLQHGSVLLHTSRHAPELRGIAEITGGDLSAAELAMTWAGLLARELGFRLERSALSSPEHALAAQFARDQFQSAVWTNRR